MSDDKIYEDSVKVFLGINKENHVLVGCVCGYRTTTYTLEDIKYFEEVGFPTCCYCGEIMTLEKRQYKEL